jgi:fibronectin-binding autotransporter adhesin
MGNMGSSGSAYIHVGNGTTTTIAVPVTNVYAGATASFNVRVGTGTLRFTGGNTIPQDIDIERATVEARTIGMAGEAGDIGLGRKITLSLNGALRYTGSGETTDRPIEIGYQTNVLEQAGTGPVIFTGCVTSLAYQATLVLSNDTDVAATYAGPIVSGVQQPIIRKRGTGEWILSGANTTQGMFYHEGGTLTVGSASSLPRLTVAGGGTLKIADGVTLTLTTAKFIYNSGTLDVVPGVGSKFIVSDASRGPAPAWLTIYGRPAKYKSNGELAIANRGIVISFR